MHKSLQNMSHVTAEPFVLISRTRVFCVCFLGWVGGGGVVGLFFSCFCEKLASFNSHLICHSTVRCDAKSMFPQCLSILYSLN